MCVCVCDVVVSEMPFQVNDISSPVQCIAGAGAGAGVAECPSVNRWVAAVVFCWLVSVSLSLSLSLINKEISICVE